ncbi:MAG: hypothetical protein NTV30_04960 [Chloroflexi bacterium]|nr:hypothetical protein [Chloroflexota bacterium]
MLILLFESNAGRMVYLHTFPYTTIQHPPYITILPLPLQYRKKTTQLMVGISMEGFTGITI